jgi:cold shock protein
MPSRPTGGPRFDAAPSGPTVQATVKWYNPEKGFGFVQLANGSDAFLHASVIERNGASTVPPGATLEVRAGAGPKGPQVTEVLNIDLSTATQDAPRRPRADFSSGPPRDAEGPSVEELGTVKFYAPAKGFGFIVRDGGGKDIFIHATALNRAGITELVEGQRVAVDMVEGRKGPEATNIRLLS